jgi:SSS family solute:Na+ symporter
VRTDLIQFGVILCGLILLLKETLGKTGMEVLTEQSFPTSSAMDGQAVFSMILIVGSAYLVGPDIYSRLFSAKDGETARISALRAALILVPLAFAITILGVCARVLLPGIVPEQALPKLMITLLSPSAQGLVAAALLAAFMSSADTSLLTASSILTLDLYRTRLPEASEERLMLASRMFALVLGGLALALALSTPEIIGTLMKAYTIFTSGLLVPVLAGFYREKLNLTSTGALAALAGGGGTAVLLGQKYPLLGLGVSAVLLFAVSWLEIQVQSRRRIRG